ncbi:MAG TPA: hypothetical protein VFQ82_14025, partial [Stellaceae bacterium]|nr:hypothetical protein [Stellaceae bacterium]
MAANSTDACKNRSESITVAAFRVSRSLPSPRSAVIRRQVLSNSVTLDGLPVEGEAEAGAVGHDQL